MCVCKIPVLLDTCRLKSYPILLFIWPRSVISGTQNRLRGCGVRVYRAQYGIDLPGHGGTSVGRIPIARGQKWLCFGHFSRGDPFLLIFSKTKF